MSVEIRQAYRDDNEMSDCRYEKSLLQDLNSECNVSKDLLDSQLSNSREREDAMAQALNAESETNITRIRYLEDQLLQAMTRLDHVVPKDEGFTRPMMNDQSPMNYQLARKYENLIASHAFKQQFDEELRRRQRSF